MNSCWHIRQFQSVLNSLSPEPHCLQPPNKKQTHNLPRIRKNPVKIHTAFLLYSSFSFMLLLMSKGRHFIAAYISPPRRPGCL